MEPFGIVLLVISITLIGALLFETREYRKFRQEISNYNEIASQFIIGFETIKTTVNFNADVQRDTIDKINTHSRNLMAAMTMLEIHDRALNLHVVDAVTQVIDEEILYPKKFNI